MSVDNVYVLYSKFWSITKLSFWLLLTPSTRKFLASVIIFLLMYGYIFYKALNDFDDFSSNTQNSITVVLDKIVITANTALLSLSIQAFYKHDLKLNHILFLLNDFDVCLKKHGKVEINTRNKARRTVTILTIIFVLNIVYYIGKTLFLSIFFEKIKWILVIQIIYKYTNTFTLIRNNILTSFVYWRFFLLNKHIKSLYTSVNKRSTSNTDERHDFIDWKVQEYQLSVETEWREIEHIRRSITLCRILQDQLRNVMENIYSSHGKFYARSIFIVVVEQLKCLLHVFIVLRLYYVHEEMHPLAWFFCFSDLCFGYLGQFALTLYIINHVHDESFKTGSCVQNLFFYVKASMQTSKFLIRDLRLFALDIIHREVKISANGIYDLNWHNFLMVLGEILSYLLFVIQYHLNMDRSL